MKKRLNCLDFGVVSRKAKFKLAETRSEVVGLKNMKEVLALTLTLGYLV